MQIPDDCDVTGIICKDQIRVLSEQRASHNYSLSGRKQSLIENMQTTSKRIHHSCISIHMFFNVFKLLFSKPSNENGFRTAEVFLCLESMTFIT